MANPGFSPESKTAEVQVTFTGNHKEEMRVTRRFNFDSLAADSGNTPTTALREGLLVAKQTADGNLYAYSGVAKDGTQNPIGFLDQEHDTLINGTATDSASRVIIRGNIKEAKVVGLDEGAKATLLAMGFLFDEHPSAAAGGIPTSAEDVAGTALTVTASDNGRLFIMDVATGAFTFTLPTIALGLEFTFFNTDDQNMIISGSSNIIAFGDDAASTVTYGTASEKIGAHCKVTARYHGTTLKWFFTQLSANTIVVA